MEYNFTFTETEADVLLKALNAFNTNLISKIQNQFSAQSEISEEADIQTDFVQD